MRAFQGKPDPPMKQLWPAADRLAPRDCRSGKQAGGDEIHVDNVSNCCWLVFAGWERIRGFELVAVGVSGRRICRGVGLHWF